MIHHPVLDQAASAGIKLGLERVRSFLAFLGEPHRAYPTIHVGGTNGKGSVTAMVTAALVDAGYRVGTNISPHLEDVNERVQLDGMPLDDASLIEAIEQLDRARWEWARGLQEPGIPLTYFEFLTVLAMQVFAQRGVDVGVFEVGLGGRLDATNVLEPVVTAITTIGLDHMDVLGGTLAEIAGEKAGILKRGAPVILGALPGEAREIIEGRARALDLTVWRPGREFTREHRGGLWSLRGPEGALQDVRLGLRGEHQGANALVALGVLQSLRRQGFHIPDSAIRSGLERATIAGRIETLAPGLIADGCHNLPGALAFARWLADQPRPEQRILLFGLSHDRDPRPLLEPLLPLVDEVVLTRCAHPKASEPAAIGALLDDVDAVLSDGGPIEEALPEVYAEADEVIVAGSLYLVGAARSLVRAGALQQPRSS